eukprot:GHUV01032578.1.p1 GENE.GHUV01032578.1~~GHUV01032578.1.p1  ORF type:complete len:248 (+),score=73.99 GHUV01032578.1:170-913(+)
MKEVKQQDLVALEPLQFKLGRAKQRHCLVKTSKSAQQALVVSSSGSGRSVRRRKQRNLGFASVTAAMPVYEATSSTRPMPLFMVASAAETKLSSSSSAPQWRLIAANLGAGATAGCAVEAALYPIDTIKTRLQAMIGGGGFKALMSAGGGKGLYAGIWGNLAGVAPSSAIFMAVYEPVKQWVYRNSSEDRHWLGPVVAGAAAGAAASLTRVPTEVIKQRLQTREFAGAMSAVRQLTCCRGDGCVVEF